MTHVNFLYRRVHCLTRIFNSCEIACEKTLATAVGGQSNKMKYKFDIPILVLGSIARLKAC